MSPRPFSKWLRTQAPRNDWLGDLAKSFIVDRRHRKAEEALRRALKGTDLARARRVLNEMTEEVRENRRQYDIRHGTQGRPWPGGEL